MTAAKVSMVALALMAGLVVVQAAGGIKGLQRLDDSQRLAVKGPSALRPPQQQTYLPPPPPPPEALLPPPPPPRPIVQAPIKGPGSVTPIFTPARVQPVLAPPAIIQQQEQEPEPVQQLQQQQQVEEVEPNPAAQDNVGAAIVAPAAPARAGAASEEEANPRPEPYAFQYAFESGDSATSGSSQREEQQDASGRVTGFYTLKGEDGRDRRVDYVADASGFRATISTNEMGTAPKDSADVDWNAQQPSEGQLRSAEAATQAARQRQLLNPQQQQQPLASASSRSPQAASKFSSPRLSGSLANSGPQFSAQASKTSGQVAQQQQPIAQQLQEPFEQIRQTELKGRARKSRHAPFYLFTI